MNSGVGHPGSLVLILLGRHGQILRHRKTATLHEASYPGNVPSDFTLSLEYFDVGKDHVVSDWSVTLTCFMNAQAPCGLF